MKKIPVGTKVKVDGGANQWPFERLVDTGTVIAQHPHGGYLVKLDQHRENLFFLRRDLTITGK